MHAPSNRRILPWLFRMCGATMRPSSTASCGDAASNSNGYGDAAPKYDCGGFCIGFAVSCNDIVSKYGLVLGYCAHVRYIAAKRGVNPYLKPVSQHETVETVHVAAIRPSSTDSYGDAASKFE